MNIFVLDENIEICAQYHCDKHVVKMITEYNQLMSTACHVLNINIEGIYKKTHVNHPCAIWVRENRSNFKYLLDLNKELLKEYTFRYNKTRAGSKLIPIFESVINQLPSGNLTSHPICMPNNSKINKNVILSYRQYYINDKQKIAKWKNRDKPNWFIYV
jgi:hypothetical protein